MHQDEPVGLASDSWLDLYPYLDPSYPERELTTRSEVTGSLLAWGQLNNREHLLEGPSRTIGIPYTRSEILLLHSRMSATPASSSSTTY